MKKTFRIGKFNFIIDYPDEFILMPYMFNFETNDDGMYYTYHIHMVDEIKLPSRKEDALRLDAAIYNEGDKEHRLLGFPALEKNYAMCIESDDNNSDIYFLSSQAKELALAPYFVSLFSLERHMIKNDSLVLHCAYMCYEDEAILLSAPSGGGKTTHAGLWEKYKGATVVNGDKALIYIQDGRWVADGWPVCGTSGVCYNKKLPIRAIVTLTQEKSNNVRVLSPSEAFFKLYAQITINSWNKTFQNHAMDLIERLLDDIKVYHLGCDISKEAVDTLSLVVDVIGGAHS